ncbi:MAG TPA: hypothetical protein VJN63_03840 [Thermoplasmata archaeon]|nr:hypothetical protein [Thermoplasmata archaeon]
MAIWLLEILSASEANDVDNRGVVGMSARLTVGMKATMGLILAFIIFLVTTSIGTLAVGSWDIYFVVSLVIFVPLSVVLLVFAWKVKRWAYLGTVVLGGILVVGSAPSLPTTAGEQIPPLLLWETMLATMLGLLMALEGYKSYSETMLARGES